MTESGLSRRSRCRMRTLYASPAQRTEITGAPAIARHRNARKEWLARRQNAPHPPTAKCDAVSLSCARFPCNVVLLRSKTETQHEQPQGASLGESPCDRHSRRKKVKKNCLILHFHGHKQIDGRCE